MYHTINQTIYKAFGLSIQSDIALPELQLVEHPHDTVDVIIRYTDLYTKWLEHADTSRTYVCTETLSMFRVPDLAVFAVEDGTTIYISPEEGVAEDKLRLYVLGTCMGAILLQRRILPLHGSAIVIDERAYAFVGHAGHGKSTLASAFLQQGYPLLTDDVIAVTWSNDHIPYVTPAYPQQKLWQESLDTLGMDANQYRPLFERETKYAIPVSSQYCSNSFPLAGIFELMKTDCTQHVQLRTVHKLERLPLLYRHTYRNLLLSDSGLTKWHFDMTARLSGSIDIYQLQRPLNENTVQQLTTMVLEAINLNSAK